MTMITSQSKISATIANASQLPQATAAVIDIPPDNRIYSLGKIQGTFHVYNTGNPPGGNTAYELTIVNQNAYQGVLQPGHTDTFNGGGNAVYIQNHGPSKLQVLTLQAERTVPGPTASRGRTMSRLVYMSEADALAAADGD